MKIAILSTDNSKIIKYGGKHVHQNLLERGLVKLGYNLKTFYPPIPNSTPKMHRIFKRIFLKPKTIFSYYERYKEVIEQYFAFFSSLKLDCFNLSHFHDAIALYSVNHPVSIITLHGYLAKETVNYMPDNYFAKMDKHKIFNFCMEVERKALEKARYIITVDTRIKKYVMQEFGFPEDRITVMYNAIDTDLFSPITEEEKNLLRDKLKLPKKSLIVLVPRRYVKKNGVDYAAMAFSKIKSKDYFFVFIGDGNLKLKIKEILKDNDNALILNALPNSEIHEYYKAADVVLIPSVNSDDVEEATSLSMLEGMACGKVTICTNVGGMKEIVKHMENGLLIEQKKPEAIIEILQYVKNNYEGLYELRQKARKYVTKNHSYIEHTKKTVEIYKKVLADNRR